MSTATYSLQDILAMIQNQGASYGLTQDQINAAEVIAKFETASGSSYVGDNGQSFGPFMFNVGGQLPGFTSFLQSLGFANFDAGQMAVNRPDLAIQYALGQGGYLSSALKKGSSQGNSGLNLALFGEQFGQIPQWSSAVIAAITADWLALFGGSGSPPAPSPPAPSTGGGGGGSTTTPSSNPAQLTFGNGLMHLGISAGIVLVALVLLGLGIYLIARQPINQAVASAGKAAA